MRPATAAVARQPTEEIFAGRYRIERKLGQGGMGSVYLATQLVVNRQVAIKVLDASHDDPVMASRFAREARVIARLSHPHVVQLIDFGETTSGQLYLVMEYIDGEPLKDLIAREAPLSEARVVAVGLQLADALGAAHAMGVIHRDLKPDNIMLVRQSADGDVVKMLDFGVARIVRSDRSHDTVQTQAGLIVGSLRYISPEQVESGEITPQTDLYAYGAILYELLSGQRVFDYVSPADCAIAHLTEAPRPPRRNGVPLSGALVDLVMQCLEKVPGRRPASAHEVMLRLRAVGAAAAPAPSRAEPAAPPTARAEPTAPSSRAAPRHHRPDLDATLLEVSDDGDPTASWSGGEPGAVRAALTSERHRTDCALELRGNQRHQAARPDANLRVGLDGGLSPAALALRGALPEHTSTHPRGAPWIAPPRRRGMHPALIALALVILAGLGALFTMFVIVPATRPAPMSPPALERPAAIDAPAAGERVLSP